MHPHHSGQSGRQPRQPKHSLPQGFPKVRGNPSRLKASHSCSLVLVTVERDATHNILIGCICRYIYRPRPRLYKEGGGPNNKYKDMYRYT
jgi:hypothetical protein